MFCMFLNFLQLVSHCVYFLWFAFLLHCMFLTFIHCSRGSSLFIFRLLFYIHYIRVLEITNFPSDEQFAVLTSLLLLRHAL